jgi:hypothetical protein
MWHVEGQEFLLSVAFDSDAGIVIPTNYYVGLDNRAALTDDDTMLDFTGEPTTHGYSRQPVSSTTGFTVALKDGIMTASSGISTFTAVGGSFGPVANVFLTTTSDNSGYLIASSALSSPRTIATGESMTVKINLSFAGCP